MARVVGNLNDAEAGRRNRILREWTPILLRSILIAAMILLVSGLDPGLHLRTRLLRRPLSRVQQGHLIGREKFALLSDRIRAGNPHAVLTLGLFVLTLVPLARVAFCFILFIRERDYTYVALTAYVLAGLIVGVLVGSVG